MNRHTSALRAAFPVTLPVLTGYLFLGLGFGVLMAKNGFGVPLTFVMSLTCLAGTLQYFSLTLLTAAFQPLFAAAMTLMLGARHLFYGIPLLEKFRGTGKFKPYLIFGLTDETFSLHCATPIPQGVDSTLFLFYITALDHSYWICGSVLGVLVGGLLRFDTTGLDFVLTALFVVIFIGQWRGKDASHPAALLGIGCTVVCLLIFGPEGFLPPAMALILLALTLLRRPLETKGGKGHDE